MDKLKKMRLLLLLPVWGSLIIMAYLKFKSHSITYIKHKRWFFVCCSMVLMFFVGHLLFAIILTIINKFVDVTYFVSTTWAAVVAATIGGYLANTLCLLYVNSILNKSKSENGIASDKNDVNEEIENT